MKKLYLFSFFKEVEFNDDKRKEKVLVLFLPYKDINFHTADIFNQLRSYFQRNILPDKIIAISAEYNEKEIIKLFEVGSEIYDYIPLFTLDSKFENVSIQSLSKAGFFEHRRGFNISTKYLAEIINRGLVKIFNENGGLIVSQSAHHFVFPSGKHSDRFLRPGNVLLKGTHILFIAFAIYHHYKERKFTSIYSDTSSINSLAFAFTSLIKEFDPTFELLIDIESFGSYQGFESSKFSAPKESLFLISSSTSGSIIRRMLEDRKRIIQDENICIIYGLDVEQVFSNRVVCDLTFNADTNPDGLHKFESYNVSKGQECKFCKDNSKAVEVKGDVFLLEKPVINGKLLSIFDNPPHLKNFSNFFAKGPENESNIKCYYKENSQDEKKYEIYFDIEVILSEWNNRAPKHSFEKIFIKLEKYILQNIPASVKYLIVVPDVSSELLAKIIVSVLRKQGIAFDETNILQIKEIDKIDNAGSGSIVVVSSSVATGRNLLFVSRALRDYEDKYQRIYFTFINRTSNTNHFDFLESNLSHGEFGKGTHKIINVERIVCPHDAYDTPWHIEKDFLKELYEFCEEKNVSPVTMDYCLAREGELNESGTTNGLINNLFFPNIKNEKLKIRRGFAFAPNQQKFNEQATQADIYFIISIILNEVRCRGELNQSEYVRNLLEPGNFVRFNDGVIQAAILRAAKADELRYDLSATLSLQLQAVLDDMISHLDNEHAEGILEFLYAIAIKKLRLTSDSLIYCLNLIESKLQVTADSIIKGLILYIQQRILTQSQKDLAKAPIVEDEE